MTERELIQEGSIIAMKIDGLARSARERTLSSEEDRELATLRTNLLLSEVRLKASRNHRKYQQKQKARKRDPGGAIGVKDSWPGSLPDHQARAYETRG